MLVSTKGTVQAGLSNRPVDIFLIAMVIIVTLDIEIIGWR
jgi:hypothetical protein